MARQGAAVPLSPGFSGRHSAGGERGLLATARGRVYNREREWALRNGAERDTAGQRHSERGTERGVSGRARSDMAEQRKIRVLVAKPGLDGHDRGAKVIARALRDAGMEVIYTGIRQTPQMIVEAAIQEDVDAILMSILSGAHMAIFPKVTELLRENGVDDVLVMAGGILPDEDIPAIKAMGIEGNFGPGTPMATIIEYVRQHVRPERLSHDLSPMTASGTSIEEGTANQRTTQAAQ
jgi:methylmalonyl-CoA mutase C-terminal domain/subunit